MGIGGAFYKLLGNRWIGLSIFTLAFYFTISTLQDFLERTPTASTGIHLLELLSVIVYVIGAFLVIKYIK